MMRLRKMSWRAQVALAEETERQVQRAGHALWIARIELERAKVDLAEAERWLEEDRQVLTLAKTICHARGGGNGFAALGVARARVTTGERNVATLDKLATHRSAVLEHDEKAREDLRDSLSRTRGQKGGVYLIGGRLYRTLPLTLRRGRGLQ